MKTIVSTPLAPAAIGPYSQAIKAGGFIFTAGQLGLDPQTGLMAGNDIATQTRRALDNIQAIVSAAGSSLARVIKTTIYVVDLDAFSTINAIYGEYFSAEPPARSTVQVAALPRGGLIEIEAVALMDE